MVMLKCISSNCDPLEADFSVGAVYDAQLSSFEDCYILEGDDGHRWLVNKSSLEYEGKPNVARFEIYEEPSESVSDEYEEEEWMRFCDNRDIQHCTMEESRKADEELAKELAEDYERQDCKCDVAFAYQLSRIQKYLRDYDSTIELVVTKDYLAIITEDCKEFRGNVEQIIDYIRLNGELETLVEDMDRRN